MASSSFPSQVTGVTVETATSGALSGDGSSGNKLAVGVDGVTVTVNGSNQLVAASGGTPGGSDTQVQFNDAGSFGGDAALTWDGAVLTAPTVALADFTIPSLGGGQVLPSVGVDGRAVETIVQDPPALGSGAPNVAPVLAGAGAGNLSNGVYRYKFTFVTQGAYTGIPGETTGSVASDPVTVTNHTTNGQVTIPDLVGNLQPIGNDDIGGVNIYRTAAGGSVYKFVGTYNDADFVDNVADASLGATIPSVNTTVVINPIVNQPFVASGPSTLIQGFTEIIGFTIPKSKMAGGGASLNLQTTGWQSADGGTVYQGTSFVVAPADSGGPGRVAITAAGDLSLLSPTWGITAAGAVTATSVIASATAYASLPSPSASTYPIAVVNNSTVTSGTVSAGGGAHVNVIVWDGTNWQVLKNLT